MRVAVVQMDCVVGNIQANTAKMLTYIENAALDGAETIVFPEMSDTGYFMPEIVESASQWDAGPLVLLAAAARRHAVHVIAGLSERADGAVYNAIASIGPEGSVRTKYRKTHLVTIEPMFEDHYLGIGTELVVGAVGDHLAGFMTCYDVRFPEVSRALMLAGATVIILPAAFPLIRAHHWNTLVSARAIENQLYVIAANRIGTDGPGLTFCGASQIVDPYGTIMASASATEETLLIADLSFDKVDEVREAIQITRDRRPDLYKQEVMGTVAADTTVQPR